MPEEHNRVLTDHCADLLFCPTKTAVENLAKEGLTKGVHEVGDPMYDAVLMFSHKAQEHSNILQRLGLKKRCYLLLTIHRAYHTDDTETLGAIFSALQSVDETIVFPVHPRTQQKLRESGLLSSAFSHGNLHLIDPVNYLDMLILEQNARIILTDSGGVRVVAGALDELEPGIRQPIRQDRLMFRREQEVPPARKHQRRHRISASRSMTVQPFTTWRYPKIVASGR